jgi:hypothetical protein
MMVATFSNNYPDDWKEIADRAKGRNGWRCVRCGHPHETPGNRKPCDDKCRHKRDGKQRMLTVHHFDGDKNNCAWWNLGVLCQVCHLTIQGKVVMERPWMFPHSEWFKPYVAGYYAHLRGLPEDYDSVIANLEDLLDYTKVKVQL